MTNRIRFQIFAVTVLIASLVLAGGSARAATITHFEGQYSSGPGLPNMGISTDQPGTYTEGTGQKIFYLSSGSVSSTQDFSKQWNGLALNDLTVNVSGFTADNPIGIVTAFRIGDSTLLEVLGASIVDPHADFTMAAAAKITSDQESHATIEIGVTLRPLSSDPKGDDLTTFITAGGGIFTIDIDNIKITQPTTDGQVFFPVDRTKQVTVHWSINPVPEPSSLVSMLIGAGLLTLWARRRSRFDKVTS
jgi:hypothetical protein